MYQKPQSYEVQFLRYRVRQICFVILDNFCTRFPPSLHPNNPENQNFEKTKNASVDVILNLCNKNYDKIMYAYPNMECKTYFFVILDHFLLFYPTIDRKN